MGRQRLPHTHRRGGEGQVAAVAVQKGRPAKQDSRINAGCTGGRLVSTITVGVSDITTFVVHYWLPILCYVTITVRR